jgi:hypothetical protein
MHTVAESGSSVGLNLPTTTDRSSQPVGFEPLLVVGVTKTVPKTPLWSGYQDLNLRPLDPQASTRIESSQNPRSSVDHIRQITSRDAWFA